MEALISSTHPDNTELEEGSVRGCIPYGPPTDTAGPQGYVAKAAIEGPLGAGPELAVVGPQGVAPLFANVPSGDCDPIACLETSLLSVSSQ